MNDRLSLRRSLIFGAAAPSFAYGLYVIFGMGSANVLSLLLGIGYAAPSIVTSAGVRLWATNWIRTCAAVGVTLLYFLFSVQVWLEYLQPGPDSVALAVFMVPMGLGPMAIIVLAISLIFGSRRSGAARARRLARPDTDERSEPRRWIVIGAAVPGILFGLYAVAALGASSTGLVLGAAYALPSAAALARLGPMSATPARTYVAAGATLVQLLVAYGAWVSMDGVIPTQLPAAVFAPLYLVPALIGAMVLGTRLSTR